MRMIVLVHVRAVRLVLQNTVRLMHSCSSMPRHGHRKNLAYASGDEANGASRNRLMREVSWYEQK